MSRHLSGDFADEVRTLRYLRNIIARPAKMPVKTGENSADEFCFRTEREPAFYELAPSLLDHWSRFADHRVTRFALRRLNTAGRAYGRQLGLLPQVVTSKPRLLVTGTTRAATASTRKQVGLAPRTRRAPAASQRWRR